MYCNKYKIKNMNMAKLKVDMGRDKPTYDRFVLLFLSAAWSGGQC